MARKKSRIGFDPLAWMKEGRDTRAAARDEHRSPPVATAAHGPMPPVAARRDPQAASAAAQGSERASGESPQSGYGSIHLGESLTIAQVQPVYEALTQRLAAAAAAGGSVTLDGSLVEAVDTAGAQLLVAFLRALEARGIGVRWHPGPSPALSECARRLGLREALRLT